MPVLGEARWRHRARPERSCLALFFSLLTGASAHAAEITVFAAASLKDALDQASAAYGDRSPNSAVASYAASSALAKQIENGAPADIFISADAQWMDYLQKRGLIDRKTRKDLLGNRLVMIVPSGSTVTLNLEPGLPLARLLGDEYLAVGDPDHVPAGRYAKAALEWLGAWDTVAVKLARAENVRSALAFVALGECPLGIVYESDAKAEPKVRMAGLFPQEAHPQIIYPIGLTKTASEASRGFYDFLLSDDAKAVFLKYGFLALE
jgi:molybdate transport system substrate-binding protein